MISSLPPVRSLSPQQSLVFDTPSSFFSGKPSLAFLEIWLFSLPGFPLPRPGAMLSGSGLVCLASLVEADAGHVAEVDAGGARAGSTRAGGTGADVEARVVGNHLGEDVEYGLPRGLAYHCSWRLEGAGPRVGPRGRTLGTVLS